MMKYEVELETSAALLDVGVSIPIKEWKIPLTKKKWGIRLTMKRPCLGNQIRIASKYLELGVTYEQMKQFDKDEELSFLARHGKDISEMIALTICRSKLSGLLLTKPVAWMLRWMVDDVFLSVANRRFISLLGTRNFTNIIRSVEWSNPLKPRLSQKSKGS